MDLQDHIKAMVNGALAMQQEAMKAIEKRFESGSKEDAEEFWKAYNSPAVKDMVKREMDSINEINKMKF